MNPDLHVLCQIHEITRSRNCRGYKNVEYFGRENIVEYSMICYFYTLCGLNSSLSFALSKRNRLKYFICKDAKLKDHEIPLIMNTNLPLKKIMNTNKPISGQIL